VIPVALRRWRKGIFSRETRAGWRQLCKQLHTHHYDLILDAQGLVKSAFLSYFTKGVRAGLDSRSARESLASYAYQHKYTVNFYQHAIIRMRSLFSQALGYAQPVTPPDFGLARKQFQQQKVDENYVVFLHGTTWATKQWPESYWVHLAKIVEQSGYRVKISGYSAEEMERVTRIGRHCTGVDVLPCLEISAMARLLANAKAVEFYKRCILRCFLHFKFRVGIHGW